jgi:hypothetical protein
VLKDLCFLQGNKPNMYIVQLIHKISIKTYVYTYTLAPSGPPLNIRTTSRSASSLSFAWDPPETTKQNGVIINYTACVSHSENGPYFQTFTTRERKWLVRNLNTSTKYFVRVLASTKVGHGIYSESEGFFTNGSKYKHMSYAVYIAIFRFVHDPKKMSVLIYIYNLVKYYLKHE